MLMKVLLNSDQITPVRHQEYWQPCEGTVSVRRLHVKDGTSAYVQLDVATTLLLPLA